MLSLWGTCRHVAALKFVLVGGQEAGHHNNPVETKQEPGQAAV